MIDSKLLLIPVYEPQRVHWDHWVCIWFAHHCITFLQTQFSDKSLTCIGGLKTCPYFFTFLKLIFADIKKQVYELCTSVYQIKGYMKGKTLLPFPQVISRYFSKVKQECDLLFRMRRKLRMKLDS